MNTLEVTLGSLVDRALLQLQAAPEQGRQVVLGESLTTTDTQFQLTGSNALQVSDLVEFGTELMLVVAKSQDANPIYTVARGYYQTTAATHTINDIGETNPQWNRVRVAEGVKRSFRTIEAAGVFVLRAELLVPELSLNESRYVIPMPEETRDVWSVRGTDLYELGRWEFVDDLPKSEYSTGKLVRLPISAGTTSDFYVTYRVPYRWDSFPDAPDEDSTIELPEGTEDIPAHYAAAWCLSAREISRTELDRAEEWGKTEPIRGGASLAHARALWQEFYRSLDEARRLDPPPPRRPFVRRPR